MPATLSIVSVIFPPSERARAVAWVVPTSRDDKQRPLDVVGAGLSILGLGCLLFGIIEGPELGWGNPILLGCFGTAVAGFWAFVRWERHVRFPMLDPRFFRNRTFTLGSVTITLTFLAMFGTFFILTQYFQFAQGHSPLGAGVRTLPPSIVMILTAPHTPRVVARFGTRATISAGRTLPPEAAGQLRDLAVAAFERGMTLAFSTAASVLLIAAVVIYRLYPADEPAGSGATAEVGAAEGRA